jgi:predicted acylesterase/phospholipase RssA
MPNKVALAWEGGGAKGAFGVGVIKALDEELDSQVWFDAVAGSSVGGLNGILAAVREIEKLEKIWKNLNSKKIYQFNLLSLFKKSLYTARPLQKLLEKEITDELLEKIKDKKIFLTGLKLETNELLLFSKFKNRQELIHALLAVSAIPAIFEPQKTEKGDHLIDGALKYHLPLWPLLNEGYQKIVAIIHEPLNLEDWTGIKKEIEYQPVRSLKDFINRFSEIFVRNLTYKDLEKVLLAKIFREKLKEISIAILTEIDNKKTREKIEKLMTEIDIPHAAELVIISPPEELNEVLDFSKKSIQKAIDLGYKVGREKIPEVKKLFGLED